MSNLLKSNRWVVAMVAAFVAAGVAGALALHAAEPAGETVLFNGKDLAGWKLRNASVTDCWKVVSTVALDPADAKKLVGTGEGGTAEGVLFRQPVAHGCDLMTEKTWGDCEVHVEFMVPKGSNSGVYLMGRYEVQVLSDTFGKADDKLGPGDMCGIYNTKAPTSNATKAPGEWQTLDVVFQTPRFDADGKKTQNAKFVSVIFNGKKIHDNVEAPKPTGGEIGKEAATGPLMLQGDHGVVAFRNIKVKAADIK